MRVLMVTTPLPTSVRPGSMAPAARQFASMPTVGVDVEILEVTGVKALKYVQCLPRLAALAASVDLIHAHYGYCGWLARSQFRKPVVVSFMGDDLLGTPDVAGRASVISKIIVQLDRWFAHTTDAVIVKSAEMAKIVAPVQSYIIPNGVDLETFQPMSSSGARGQLGLDDHKQYILFPGRPTEPRKGFALAQAVVAKASPLLTAPLELLTLWGVAPDRVPAYMNACNAMLLTSFWEGSPNVVKEAMACNTPIVSVTVGDVPELLADVAGCVVCPRDVDVLANALVHVLNTASRTDGRLALERKGLDLRSTAQKIKAVYQDVLRRSAHVRHRGLH
jgi:glycosyltransferase involved in cell wall biosynthesis